ncbi:MAG: DNA-binding response regulator [Phormidesmis sp.]
MGIEQSGWRQLLIDQKERLLESQPTDLASESRANQLRQQLSYFLVVDDHDVVLEGLLPKLNKAYPNVMLLAAQDVETAQQQLAEVETTSGVVSLAMVDLDLPEKLGETANCQAGIQLLRYLMRSEQVTNILTMGANIKPLIRISSEIYSYPAGFTAIHKAEPVYSILRMADLALRGSIYLPPDVRSLSGFKPQWLTLLSLKFKSGLSDQEIANRMGVSTRTTRNYWLGIQDFLGVYNQSEKDLRVQVEHAARKVGLID